MEISGHGRPLSKGYAVMPLEEEKEGLHRQNKTKTQGLGRHSVVKSKRCPNVVDKRVEQMPGSVP